ncbi:hypothetical protein BG015_009975 [Linnemannia schmuckeri]|uniref:Uncharacterized protein n=1 Tax=Linnemannia schmuckeri TaxID=64567 RepID=A0A9P5V970_9FUNG|nr:hypothetical protein BG015_009975 [Linnemannia schmuckeri]
MSSKSSTTAKPTATPTGNPSAGNPSPTTQFNLPTGTAGNSGGADGSPQFNLPTGTGGFNYPAAPTGTDPNSPNYLAGQANSAGGSTGSSDSSNVPIIVGITVAGVAVLAIVGLLVQRYKARSRTNTINSHQTRSRNKHNQAAGGAGGAAGGGNMSGGEDGDRAKLAKSFTIRKPPSVYVDDDQDLDQTGHPRYKSASDAQNHPYYGDHRTPGLVEYELSDTSGQKYGPSSVAERKRYVEQQQRKVMDEYEMFNPHRDLPPQSPYPASLNSAPSYTSRPLSPPVHHGATSPTPMMTPSMGGRSPRVNHPAHQPFGRNLDQQMDNDYKY